jgi:HK97 family phage major capsid protein
MKSNELKKDRASLIAQAKQLIDEREKAGVPFSDEDDQNYTDWTNKAEQLREQIVCAERREWVSQAEVENTRIERKIKPMSTLPKSEREQGDINLAYDAWFRKGYMKLTDQTREQASIVGLDLEEKQLEIKRQNTQHYLKTRAGLNKTDVSNWVPTDFYTELQEKLLAYGSMMSVAHKYNTADGNTMVIPCGDDTGNVAVLTNESGSYDNSDPVDSKVSMYAFKFTTSVTASREQLRDNQFPLLPFIQNALGTRISRGTESYFALGDGGTTQPQGVINGAAFGTKATDISYNVFVDLVASVDPLYLQGSGTKAFMMHSTTWARAQKLTDDNHRPLVWSSNDALSSRAVGTILGYPVIINNSFPQFSAASGSGSGENDKPIVFGNFEYYWIRLVDNIYFQRLNELQAKNGLVDFLCDITLDGRVISAGSPLVYYQVHA